ncbi:Bug family tripartite tricarboxylate transporter substrate binding protein [Thalassobacter stenotrophicus]|uniref:Tripartite tricarboxylate transporter family receptor n=2 Tax=Thalassobacter stenotrophicus TaxID=266809 RepID=A0A0P1EYC2_9RHOB|nr:tripartite tricarboxylate transporter substrate binding protein [Thalassobacter stenotrophicus]CUH60145.1 Tripartite tricarboxylate transporter family receptor [Thalassobacter stenotrophicus]SHJ19360.1 Tripartite-type tricarboxylate transporter, receptor component TctC [Thalassobacter stenotrophicus DSM 16310]
MKKLLALASAAALLGGEVLAEEYPTKTIEVITHAGNGGGTDVTTRMMMIRARRELGADMVVVNKRGGGGATAMDYYLTQEADGHSILTFTIGHSATVALGKTDLTLDDVRPIARGTDDPQILMTRCGVYDNAEAFVAAQKDDPLTYGTTQLGNIDDVSAFMFTRRGELATPKIIPFDGGGELATQLVAGAVDVAVLNLSEAGSQISAGDICPMVVLAPERMSGLPDVSTAQELGIDANFSTVRGFVVHADTPDDVAAKIEASLMNAMSHSIYQGFLTSVGLDANSVAGSDVWGNQLTSMQADMDAALRELGFIE